MPGFMPKAKTKRARPMPEMAPRARLPYLEPTYKASRTIRSSSIIVIMAFVFIVVYFLDIVRFGLI